MFLRWWCHKFRSPQPGGSGCAVEAGEPTHVGCAPDTIPRALAHISMSQKQRSGADESSEAEEEQRRPHPAPPTHPRPQVTDGGRDKRAPRADHLLGKKAAPLGEGVTVGTTRMENRFDDKLGCEMAKREENAQKVDTRLENMVASLEKREMCDMKGQAASATSNRATVTGWRARQVVIGSWPNETLEEDLEEDLEEL